MKKLINEIMPMAMSVVLTVKVSLLGSMLLLGFEASANHPLAISFTTETKPWQLVIDHELLAEKEAKIADHERDIAKELQILLSENRYQAVADILVKRDISQDSAALLLLRGQVHLLLKNDQLAEQALLAGLVKMPQLIKAEQGLSLLYMQRQDYQKAKQHLIRAIELGVADSQIYGQLAYVHQQLEQPWAAVAGYRQALFLAPENIQYQQGLLYALLK